jgi:hypothetical protein
VDEGGGMDVARSSIVEKDIMLQFPHLDCVEPSHFLWIKVKEQRDTSSVEFHIGFFLFSLATSL